MRTPSRYSCVNCGHVGKTNSYSKDYITCPSCLKPINRIVETPEKIKGTILAITESTFGQCSKVTIDIGKDSEVIEQVVYIDVDEPIHIYIGLAISAKLIRGVGRPINEKERGYYYITRVVYPDSSIKFTRYRKGITEHGDIL